MKILVTGGAGFIGTNLIRLLLKEGHTVYSIDSYITGLVANHQKGCTYLTDDVRNIASYEELFKNLDVIYHLAALARIKPSFDNPKASFDNNVTGTYDVVHFAHSHNIPLIYAGTSSKHSGRFKNPYTWSKDLGEDIIKLYQEHFGLRASIARFYNVYGPYQLLEGPYCTVIGIWLRAYSEGRPLLITGDGEQRRDFTHIDDLVRALYLIAIKQTYGYEFELGRGSNHSLNELKDVIGPDKFTYIESRVGEARETLCTDKTAQKILGWSPSIDVLDYIEKTFK